jgi:hypothetical protein
LFLVSNPALADAPVLQLAGLQIGDTRTGTNRVDAYRYPVAPFGNQPDRPPMVEDGAERLYVTSLDRPAVNIGVSVLTTSPGARIDPFYLGPTKDESSVQGFAGTPVDVNALTFDYLLPVSAAGASFPRQGRYYVAVDSGRDLNTDQSLAGGYVLRSWVNDVTPPVLQLLTTRVSAGRPTLVFRALDAQSGVDPLSLAIAYKGVLVGAAAFDWQSGIAVFPLPAAAPPLSAGTTVRTTMASSDFQEAKNIDTIGPSIMPNTRHELVGVHVVGGVAVDWLSPSGGACLTSSQRLVVAASSNHRVTSVRFAIDGKRVAVDSQGNFQLWSASLPKSLSKGRHTVTATAVDTKRHRATATRVLRLCRP